MNHQYNDELTRSAFWVEMTAQLASFECLVHRREHLTAIDKKILKQIHRALYESYRLAEKQRSYHSRQLERIRREHVQA